MTPRRVSRRTFLRTASAAAAVLPLLSACTTSVPAAPTAAPTAAATAVRASGTAQPKSVALGALPTFTPVQGPPPQLPGTPDGLVSPAWTSYPKASLFQSVKPTPGRGGDVSVTLEAIQPPGPPVDQNVAWQAINKAVNAKLNVTIIPFGDFNAKWATIQSSNDLPDLMCTITRPDIPIVPAFLNARCTDLTPYLAGDAVKDYPNLAAIPTRSWKSTLINGKIYGVPIPLRPYFWWFWVHQETLEQAGLKMPTSAADFKDIAQKVNKPQSNVWAIGGNGGSQYVFDTVEGLWNSVFGAPNYWSVDSAGKFTYVFEAPQYRDALAYAADLVSAGVYHPNTLAYNVLSGRNDFMGRKMVFREDGLQSMYGAYWGGVNAPPMDPPSHITLVPPFSADGNAKPVYYFGRPNFGMALVKQGDDAHTREMLRILDFFAAPFGSTEWQLINYGVEGPDFAFDDQGNPVLTDQGRAEFMPWNSLVTGQPYYWSIQEPNAAQVYQGYEKLLAPLGVEDASIGTFSATFASKGTLLLDALGSGAQDIAAGRRPMSDLDGLVQDWRNNGGNQIKNELAASYAQLMSS
ncbi:MAG: hypothetical protein JOZ81_33370 [Chloroflexi bacterium]|nr:hypothetical protein [Chloroflexota bacterium]